MQNYVTIAQTRKGKRDACLLKFIGSETLTGLTDRKIIPFFLSYLSNLTIAGRCPVELVSAILSQPIKKTINKTNLALLTTCNQSHEDLITGNEWLHKGVVSA